MTNLTKASRKFAKGEDNEDSDGSDIVDDQVVKVNIGNVMMTGS